MLFEPCVLQVLPTDNYEIYCYFNDGSVRLYDMKPYIKVGTVFEPLKSIDVFKKAATVMNNTAAWDLIGNRDPYKCIDIAPEALFESPIVKDPLELSDSI